MGVCSSAALVCVPCTSDGPAGWMFGMDVDALKASWIGAHRHRSRSGESPGGEAGCPDGSVRAGGAGCAGGEAPQR